MKFKRSDVVTLSKAVSRFNKIVNEIENKTSYTPNLQSYQELKENILTRKEFNKVVRSLKSATKENLTTSRTLGDLTLSEYEYNLIERNKRNAIASLKNELKNEIRRGKEKNKVWQARERTLQNTIDSIKNLKEKSGSSLLDTIERIDKYSNSKFYRSDINFRKFYEEQILPNLSSYEEYERLKYALDKIKSPKKFREFINQSEVLKSLVAFYDRGGIVDVKGGLSIYAMSDEDAFTYAIESELGLS